MALAICMGLAHAVVQYCNTKPQVPVHVCISLQTWYNSSTESKDLLVTFGYQKYFDGGWTAVGLGSGMSGALIFVAFLGEGEGKLIRGNYFV